jgi:hypothetical protein
MWLVGTAYNFCTPHRSLAHRQTPAMAAGITDHVWSMDELFHHRVPPARWQPPPKRGRPTKGEQALAERWAPWPPFRIHLPHNTSQHQSVSVLSVDHDVACPYSQRPMSGAAPAKPSVIPRIAMPRSMAGDVACR